MRKFSLKRFTAWLLCLMMIISVLPAGVLADSGKDRFMQDVINRARSGQNESEENAGYIEAAGLAAKITASLTGTDEASSDSTDKSSSEPVVVIAGSDFQNTSSNHAQGAVVVTNLLNQIKGAGYTKADGFLFLGDYYYDYDDSKEGKIALQEAVQAVYGKEMDEVYVQGNHDPDSLVTDGTLSSSGAHDAENYGVFVVNEKDYMWFNDDQATIQKTAANLKTYLDEKIAEAYTKPIFVVSHLPLHYCMRTKNDGDGMYANYLFDVLNEAGANGLNIIFMFGHNHSNGWDDYLGGASIYLAKGDKINIAQASRDKFNVETLNFTYMNAGYVAYYRDVNNNAETDLTMTVFSITEDEVRVERYSENGLHDLKSKGVLNNYKNESGYDPDTRVLESPQYIVLKEPAALTDSREGITVTAYGITGVRATPQTMMGATPDPNYSAWLSYDITVDGYVTGRRAVVTIPVDPTTFDSCRNALVLHDGDVIANVPIVDGKVTFTTDHFSVYSVAQLAESEVSNWVEIPGETYTIFRLTDSFTSGKKYVIVSTNQAGDANAVNLNGSNINTASVKVVTDEGGNYIAAPAASAQWTYTSSGKLQNVGDTGRWLRGGKNIGSLRTTTNASDIYTTWLYNANNGVYCKNGYIPSNITGYMVSGSSTNRVYIYVEETVTIPSAYVGMSGQTEYNIVTGAYANQAAVEKMIKNYITVYTATDANGTNATPTTDYTFTGTVNPTAAGKYTLTVTYGGKTIGTITVNVSDKTVTAIAVSPMEGEVERGSSSSKATGSKLTVTYDDGTTDTIDVTVGMLSGEYNVNKNGTYTGLSITYGGKTIENYTLKVVDVKGNNYPTYPSGGSVIVSKTATGKDFQNTGVARVDLSVSGLPSSKGVDVVIMLDTSSSMRYAVNSNTNATAGQVSRLTALKSALKALIDTLHTKDSNGNYLDVDIAIADFNSYTAISNDDGFANVRHDYDQNDTQKIYTGTKDITVGAFVDIEDVDIDSLNDTIAAASGTNYDYAFDTVYKLASAKQATETEARDLFVVFMSDGAPFQYNYFTGHSTARETGIYQTLWTKWLTGTLEESDWLYYDKNGEHQYFYNEDGLHWMAEAIKGDADKKYPVIVKDETAYLNGNQYMTEVNGLGATMYTIGLGLFQDNDISAETTETVISRLASVDSNGNPLFLSTYDEDELEEQFKSIASDICYAANNAVFEDQMGSAFDLQMNPAIKTSSGATQTVATDITVTSKAVYTAAQVGTTVGGHTVTGDDVGKTYGDATTLEKVTFAVDNGNITATSDKKDGNILVDGVIEASTFRYNTTNAVKTINVNGKEVQLNPETFYWNIGTINEKQFTLSYAVYLTGSMEGTREAGSYPTNNYATLTYTNWLGNDATQNAPSPEMPWGGATVSYAFYLVNEAGEPVDANGNVVDNAYLAARVTQPVVYHTIKLNSGDQITAETVAQDVLPEGYTLYDKNASYTVRVASGTGASSWEINGNYPASTYVSGYAGAQDYSNKSPVNDSSYDYTYTTVYFAVVWSIGTVPDTVVIDYGVPVDISVLGNDLFGADGTLAAVGAVDDKGNAPAHGTTLASGFGSSYDAKYGKAAVSGNKVRYTLSSMNMPDADKFAYAVNYTGATNPGYYYGTVTVIPATSIYFEETFVTFTDSENINEEGAKGTGVWTTAGTMDNKVQGEDRPGAFYKSDIDHNNIYGFDNINNSATTYSLGAAKTVTVNGVSGYAAKAPKASFTFTGTGFDIISVTNHDAGAIMVTVKNEQGEVVKRKSVDNYYGYNYTEEDGWVVDSNAEDSIWQVPVIKIDSLDYDTYTAEIQVRYLSIADHQADGSYSFWLDSIRIYDPAGNVPDVNGTVGGAYLTDGEYAPTYTLIKSAILASDNLNAGETIQGAVFIDGKVSTSDAADYANPGPNNEAYLAVGQGVSFKIQATVGANYLPNVHLGAKLAYGDSAGLFINGKQEETLTTATDMYYSISDLIKWTTVTNEDGTITYTSDPITISNGEIKDDSYTTDAVISLTNIKVALKKAPNAHTSDASEQPATVVNLLVDAETMVSAARVMNELYGAEPVFTPEVLEYDVRKIIKSKVVTVVTSRDVAALTINGKAVERIGNRLGISNILKNFDDLEEKLGINLSANDYYVWTYTTKSADTFEIVASNEEGLASETLTITADGTIVSGFDPLAVASLYSSSGIFEIMEGLAERFFSPERFDTAVTRTPDGESTLVVNTSEDVEYIIANGEIIDRFITETVVDLSKDGEETVSRVWIASVEDDESIEVTAYDEEGVASSSDCVGE